MGFVLMQQYPRLLTVNLPRLKLEHAGPRVNKPWHDNGDIGFVGPNDDGIELK